MAGTLTLEPMGWQGEGLCSRDYTSFNIKVSTYSKRVSCSLQCQETLSREIYFKIFFYIYV